MLLVLIVWSPHPALHLLRLLGRLPARLGRRPLASVATAGLIGFAAGAALALCGQIPEPHVHDEFSYLLAADTFAHGRVCNPTHPLWVHFESLHLIQQPAYASKFPPGQGLVLAAGQVLAGHTIFGVWLSTAAACAAICWMLRAWLPPRWALLGGLLAAVHPAMLVWSQGYWGGAVAAWGGALLLGAVRRLAIEPRAGPALVMGLGMVILANSRPFEGLVLTLVALATLAAWLLRRRPFSLRALLLRRILLPALAVLVPAAGAMGYYNRRITGDALRLPYWVHQATYTVAPSFLWQATRPEPVYRHKPIRDLHIGWELPAYLEQGSPAGFLAASLTKVETLYRACFPLLALQLPLVTVPWLWRQPWMRRALLMLGGFVLLLLQETWFLPHYAAPVIGLVLLVAVQGLRHLLLWRWHGRPVGRGLVAVSLAVSCLSLVGLGAELARANCQGWGLQRARLAARLKQQGGRHLVLVRYAPEHAPHAEWVYNEADIDNAAVVWAREMDPEQNGELLAYFQDRSVWLLEADAAEPQLVPYPAPSSAGLQALGCPGSGNTNGCAGPRAATATGHPKPTP